MTKVFGVSLFITIVLAIYFLFNWYTLSRFASLLGLRRGPLFYTIIFALTMSLVAAMSLYASSSGIFATIFYRAATMWMGMSFLFFWCHLLFHITSRLYPMPPKAIALAVFVIVTLLTVYSFVNAVTVHVQRFEMPAPVNLKIAQLSDIHIGSVSKVFLSRLIDQVNEQKPDVVLIVGDLFDNHNPTVSQAALELNRFNAPVFFSAGNHEGYVGYENVERMLAPTKVRWLQNEVVEFSGIHLIGINNTFRHSQIAPLINRIPIGGFSILMNHQPVGFDVAVDKGIDLMLSGHTHNGQIWPFKYITGSVYKYLAGPYWIDRSALYVSQGAGTWGPRMRLGTYSEFTIIELKKPFGDNDQNR